MGGDTRRGGQRVVGRREFLRGAGLAGLGTTSAGFLPGGVAEAVARKPKHKKVWRLSTRDQNACSACKAHAANRYYRHRRNANHGRAHKGCTCDILDQRITTKR